MNPLPSETKRCERCGAIINFCLKYCSECSEDIWEKSRQDYKEAVENGTIQGISQEYCKKVKEAVIKKG